MFRILMNIILMNTVLVVAITQVKFFNKFEPKDFIIDLFDTTGTNVNRGKGGNITRMNVENRPALEGQKFSFAAIILEPCAINLPHSHPRATEGLFVAEGEEQLVGFILENNVRVFTNVLKKGMATFFPQGAIHFEINLSCKRSILIPSFNSEDPGVQTTLNNLFLFNVDVLQATSNLTPTEIAAIRAIIPIAPGLGIDKCLKKCNLPIPAGLGKGIKGAGKSKSKKIENQPEIQ